MKRPEACTPIGTYGCTIPMPCGHSVQAIDFCVADIVAALNAANITTTWSCCGHGTMPAAVGLADGRLLTVQENAATMEPPNLAVLDLEATD